MKNKTKRILSAFLAIITLLSTCMVVGCSNDDENADGETQPTVSTEDNINLPQTRVPDDLRFDGQQVNILVRASHETEFDTEVTGNVIDNAIYTRNAETEERLGIDIHYEVNSKPYHSEYLSHIRTVISSGIPTYDMVATDPYYGAALATEGLYYNLYNESEKNYVNPKLGWYNQSFVDEITYSDYLPFIVGDVSMSSIDSSVVTYFNENLLMTYGIDVDLFDVVESGEWTLEYLKGLVKDVYADVDGIDGETDKDTYGLYFNRGSMCIDAMIVAMGIRVTERNANGELSIAINKHRNVDAYKALYDFIYETSGVRNVGHSNGGKDGSLYDGQYCKYYSEDRFFEGRSMFTFGMLSAAKVFSTDPELMYGILPLPKYDKDQAQYSTCPQDSYSIIAIPFNIDTRLEIATATLEILSQRSYVNVRPAFYDIAFKIRYASGENTAKLFDSIIDNITYNFGSVYSHSLKDPVWEMRNRLAGLTSQPISNLSTITNQYNVVFKTKLTALLDIIEENKVQ